MKQQMRFKSLPFWLVASAVFVGVLVYLYGRNSWPDAVTSRLEELRQQGTPVTLQELDQSYTNHSADQQMAAEHFFHAFGLIKSRDLPVPGKQPDDRGLPSRWSREETMEVAKCLSDNAEALKLLHEGRHYPTCRFPIDFTDGYETLLPHLPQARLAAQLLALEALHHAHERRPGEAAQSIQTCLHLARMLESEPLVISRLVRNAIAAIACIALRDCLALDPFSEDNLLPLSEDLRRFLTNGSLSPALNTERCLGLSIFRGDNTDVARFLVQGEPGFTSKASVELLRVKGILQRDCANFLEFIDRFQEIANQSPQDRLDLLAQIDREIKENRSLAGKQAADINVISGMLLPTLVQLTERNLKTEILVQTTLVGLAVERYRLNNGHPPTSLEVLVPDYLSGIPPDPYTDEPLLFSTTDEYYRVFSRGPNSSKTGHAESSLPPGARHDLEFRAPR